MSALDNTRDPVLIRYANAWLNGRCLDSFYTITDAKTRATDRFYMRNRIHNRFSVLRLFLFLLFTRNIFFCGSFPCERLWTGRHAFFHRMRFRRLYTWNLLVNLQQRTGFSSFLRFNANDVLVRFSVMNVISHWHWNERYCSQRLLNNYF